MAQTDGIAEIVGDGWMCMYEDPCVHDLVVNMADGRKNVEIRLDGVAIFELYGRLGRPVPEHFAKYDDPVWRRLYKERCAMKEQASPEMSRDTVTIQARTTGTSRSSCFS